MVKPIVPRMYVVVRKDLDQTYRMVQGSHALAQYALEHPEELKVWNNEYLIFLSTFLEVNMQNLYRKLVSKGFTVSKFNEPDQNGQMTAIALFEDGSGRVTRALEKLPLA